MIGRIGVIPRMTTGKRDGPTGRTPLTLAALVFWIVTLVLVGRSRPWSILVAFLQPNRALAAVLPIVGGLLAVKLFWQSARDLFGIGALPPAFLLVPPSAGLAVLVLLEAVKSDWGRAAARWITTRPTCCLRGRAGIPRTSSPPGKSC